MNILLPAINSLSRDIVDGLRSDLGFIEVAQFELISAEENRERYTKLVESFWNPISDSYVGSFIRRYIDGFIALPDKSPVLGVQALSSHMFIYRHSANFTPMDLCHWTFRRALQIRLLARGVSRNYCTRGIILDRTTDYVLNSPLGVAISEAYQKEAEQVGAGDAEEAV